MIDHHNFWSVIIVFHIATSPFCDPRFVQGKNARRNASYTPTTALYYNEDIQIAYSMYPSPSNIHSQSTPYLNTPIPTQISDNVLGPAMSAFDAALPARINPVRAETNPFFAKHVAQRNSSILTLGYLVQKTHINKQGEHHWKTLSGALLYAVDVINEKRIIPGFNVSYVFRDTFGSTNQSLYEMSKLWRDGIVGFIGPSAVCTDEAMLAAAWNLPILSHVSLELFVSI